LDIGEINFSPAVEECINAMVETEIFGSIAKDFIKRMIQDKVFRLDDVKGPTIWGLLKSGKSIGWITRNVPGTRKRNRSALKDVVKDKDAFPLPEELRQKLAEQLKITLEQ
jgi:hypothetical protein